MIYLDNASTTPIAPKVLDAMIPYLTQEYGNPGSIHTLGRIAKEAIEQAREQVADLIGAESSQIIFTSSGTEANNLAILGCRDYLNKIKKRHIITSVAEHESVLSAARKISCGTDKKMYIKQGFHTSYLPVNNKGTVEYGALSGEIKKDTGLVSLMYVNNEIGAVNNIKGFSSLCRKNNILFHTDAVQALGSENINVSELGVDLLSMSSHKIHGPKGVGALYVRDKSVLNSLITGAESQELGLRGGTENVAGIVGFGKACEITKKELTKISYVTFLKNLFYRTLIKKFEESGFSKNVSVNGVEPENKGKILNIRFEGIDSETLVLSASNRDVFISAGSACNSKSQKASHVLTAIGLSDDEAKNSVRISFSEYNTKEGVTEAAIAVAESVMSIDGILITA